MDSHKGLEKIMEQLEEKGPKDRIEFDEFENMVTQHQFLKKILENNVVISQFPTFANRFKQCFDQIKADPNYDAGHVADYIPTLAKGDPKKFAAAFCSVDGQFTKVGDHKGIFSIQSISKAVAYAYCHSLYDAQGRAEDVHKWVGEEPSG